MKIRTDKFVGPLAPVVAMLAAMLGFAALIYGGPYPGSTQNHTHTGPGQGGLLSTLTVSTLTGASFIRVVNPGGPDDQYNPAIEIASTTSQALKTGFYTDSLGNLNLTINGAATKYSFWREGLDPDVDNRLEMGNRGLVLGWKHYVSGPGSAGTPAFLFSQDQDTGIFWQSANNLGVAANGVGVATFTHTGVRLRGTTSDDNALAGEYGQTVSSHTSIRNVPATGAYGDLASIPLGPGDWLIECGVFYQLNGATVTGYEVAMSTTSGNSSQGFVTGDNYTNVIGATTSQYISMPPWRYSINVSTTVYLKMSATYSAGTPRASGKIIAVKPR